VIDIPGVWDVSASVVWSAAVLALSCGLAGLSPIPSIGRAQGLGDQLHGRAVRDLGTGKLLVSARNMTDPNFTRTVIVLAHFDKDGAFGLIVNRPTKVKLSRLFPRFEKSPGGATTAFLGGPVIAPGVVALLRSARAHGDSRRIVNDVYLVSSRELLEEMIAAGAASNRFRVYLGYAGWGAARLEEETAQGAWHVMDGDANVIFDPDSEATWQRQIRRTEVLSADAHGPLQTGSS
jgi:putative transcriptional regulator